MHFMPDTEDADSAAEVFWPEGYKQVIRELSPPLFKSELLKEKPFIPAYENYYKEKYPDYDQFIEKLADMISISGENGADNAFDEIIDSFLKEAPLPTSKCYAHYFPQAILPIDLKNPLRNIIISEYQEDSIYVYAYTVGYRKSITTLEAYFSLIADLVVVGAQNGINNTMENIYRSLYLQAPLIPVRRHPRRLKVW